MRRPVLRRLPARPELAELRGWSGTAWALRLVLLVSGAAAVGVGWSGRTGMPAVVAFVGVVGLLAAVAQPYSEGPAVVLGATAATWAAGHGATLPPVPATLLLAALLAVHHQTAALIATLPVTARVDRRLLTRAGTHLGLVLGLSGLVAALALGVARPGGSVPLELGGLAAAVVATGALVVAGRARR